MQHLLCWYDLKFNKLCYINTKLMQQFLYQKIYKKTMMKHIWDIWKHTLLDRSLR